MVGDETSAREADQPRERREEVAMRARADDGATAITLDGVTVDFEAVRALRDVDLRVRDGEFVTVIGPSGCGKTTLLRTVGGLQDPTTGTVRVAGRTPDRAR